VTPRSSHDRHRSIVAALDWSYELLDPGLRQTYRRLAVFRHEIPIGAAEGILEVADPAEQLAALAEVSLLVPPSDAAGYRMLEPVRQHALMRLTKSGELDATLLRHAGWIVELCENIRLDLQTGDSSVALAKLRTYGPEIEATANWALESNRPEITMAIVALVGRRWQLMFDPGHLRQMGERAIAHEDAPAGDLRLRALAHIAWMSRETDRDTAMEIAARLRSMIHETNDPDTLFDVACSLAIVPRDMSAYASRDAMIDRLGLWDEAIEWSTALGWPSEPQLYNRAVLLQDLGRHDEAEAVLQELLTWADESRPLERGRALHALARVETARGSFDTAIDMATEAAQLLVDAGDVDFAAEAQYRKAHALLLSNRPEEAFRALDVIDQYHQLIGLPPAAEEDPAIVAAIAAGVHTWDSFRASMRTWFEHAPPMDDEGAWDLFLVGDASLPSQLGLLMYPTARWLASTGRPHEAARIVACSPMAFAAMKFDDWEAIGEAERFRNLTIELEGILSEDPLTTLRDLYLFIVDCIR
jgi:tetratricopeptide (TPR) repeat protein